jgi:hypothetical protein
VFAVVIGVVCVCHGHWGKLVDSGRKAGWHWTLVDIASKTRSRMILGALENRIMGALTHHILGALAHHVLGMLTHHSYVQRNPNLTWCRGTDCETAIFNEAKIQPGRGPCVAAFNIFMD